MTIRNLRPLFAGLPSTPESHWAANGEPDPHGKRYNCERAALVLGGLSDDELANGAFMNYDRPMDIRRVIAGDPDYHPPIAWMTAVKDRIRWLSRKLSEATAEPKSTTKGAGL